MFSPRRHLPTSPILQPPDLFQSPPAAARPVHPSSRHPARKKPHPHALLSGASSYLRWRLPILLRRRLRQLDTAGVRPRRRQAALLLASSAPSPSIHASVILHQELCRVFRGYTVRKQRSAPSNIFRPPPRQDVIEDATVKDYEQLAFVNSQSQNAHAETSNATKQSSLEQSVQLHEVTKQVKNNLSQPLRTQTQNIASPTQPRNIG
ncbi:uncharacterized protein LOC125508758 isoform X2 [Triticum urartu]|uniref:uncharacterized protein LOC125508758 isoform X2 n=1 Tax=Triticum urartu TaxID=4572 RepID=UPI00204499CC|nr:uncharacterized protein LOC125508758 isoform X2 [Triticum urartu]